ncbi:MAG: hypothetical protein K1X55_15410 [Chitinophagales bacterium]|nr:hypothetical protein [Chitinophagales bacterium]
MKNKLKTISIHLLIVLAIVTSSCKKESDDNNSTGKTGTFTIDGVSYAGETEEQTFVNENYSIVCQQDDPFKLIQVTFHNQAEAEAGGTFDVEDYALNVPTGGVHVGVDGLTFDPEGSHTISVSGKKITITNLSLEQTGGGSQSPVVSNASINF